MEDTHFSLVGLSPHPQTYHCSRYLEKHLLSLNGEIEETVT